MANEQGKGPDKPSNPPEAQNNAVRPLPEMPKPAVFVKGKIVFNEEKRNDDNKKK